MSEGKSEKEAVRRKEERAVMMVLIALLVAWALYSGMFNQTPGDRPLEISERSEEPDSLNSSKRNKPSRPQFKLTVGDMVVYSGFAQDRGWSGIITALSEETYTVRIASVNTGGPLIYTLYPNECTGGEKLGPSSAGKEIVIPRNCLLEIVK